MSNGKVLDFKSRRNAAAQTDQPTPEELEIFDSVLTVDINFDNTQSETKEAIKAALEFVRLGGAKTMGKSVIVSAHLTIREDKYISALANAINFTLGEYEVSERKEFDRAIAEFCFECLSIFNSCRPVYARAHIEKNRYGVKLVTTVDIRAESLDEFEEPMFSKETFGR